MSRVLLLATTTGYQTRAFDKAAERLGVELVYATDRCDVLDDPWRDHAIPIRFHDERASTDAIVAAARQRPFDGVLAVGDRPTVIAAKAAKMLGLPGHSPDAASTARNKLLTRQALEAAGLPVPWFVTVPVSPPLPPLSSITFPCVLKPLALSASRGVMRADTAGELGAAIKRLRALLSAPDIRRERTAAHDSMLIEGFIPGHEFAADGVLHRGRLCPFAVFDKPDPLDGPFFEETIYITPPPSGPQRERTIWQTVAKAAEAIGLSHGPIHAECRVAPDGSVYVLEIAARPIGGLCARALRFVEQPRKGVGPLFCDSGEKNLRPLFSLEEVLLQHALGESRRWRREPTPSGVMMIPIPRRGVLRSIRGLDEARRVAGVDDVRITAKRDQVLVPLPEGASYLGFIFAHGDTPADVDRALRSAHHCLEFTIDPEMRVLQSHHG